MSDYSNTFGGAAKDTAGSTIIAADHDTEYDSLATHIATKANKISSPTNGNVVAMTATGDIKDSLVTSTELAILDGATVTTAELNKLDGVTSTTAELNILDGVTATAAEINKLDGVTASTAELNKLDGVTATTAELNYTDGVTSNIQTQLNGKTATGHTHTLANVTDSGALAALNSVSQSTINGNSVGQSEIKTASQTLTGVTTEFTATGGVYILGFDYQRNNSSSSKFTSERDGGSNDSSYAATWDYSAGIASNDQGRIYYISASPPYDMGDGEVALFIHALINNTTGEVDTMSIAQDPPWAYNGPTDIVPDIYMPDGTLLKRMRNKASMTRTLAQAKGLGGSAIAEWAAEYRELPEEMIEVTQSIKNADMDLIPDPWTPNKVRPGQTAVLLDPVSPIVQDLAAMYKDREGSVEVATIVREYLNIGNTPTTRKGPQGLLIPTISWK